MNELEIFPVKRGKRFYFGLIMLILGVAFLVLGIVSDYKYKRAISFEELTEDSCKDGQYIKGEITSYVYHDMGRGSINGVSEELVVFGRSVYTYTVYAGNGNLIRIQVSDHKICKALDDILKNNRPVPFAGKIVRTSDGLNYGWYESAGLENPEDIIEGYLVKEADIESGNDLIFGGFATFVVSVIYLIVYCRLCRIGKIF